MTGVFHVPLRWRGDGTDTGEESAHKVNSGEENSPAAPAGIRTGNLSITSPALYHQDIPAITLFLRRIGAFPYCPPSFIPFLVEKYT